MSKNLLCFKNWSKKVTTSEYLLFQKPGQNSGQRMKMARIYTVAVKPPGKNGTSLLLL